jgi:putative iron-regulated protein
MNKTIALITGLVFSLQAWATVPSSRDVLEHYADLAHAMYEDSLTTAKTLQQAVDTLIAQPTEANLDNARQAWIAARHPYQQTEVYRFGNAIVDDWEGKVNAWPLDEGLIDYVDTSYGTESDENPYYTANIIANDTLVISGRSIDASQITKELLAETLHEIDEIESNVATGYHAIEFMLWGQDLNGTGPGAGDRKASDFSTKHCSADVKKAQGDAYLAGAPKRVKRMGDAVQDKTESGRGHCDRRAAYLKAATDLLVDELAWMTAQWDKDGAARKALTANGENAGLAIIFTGMGSLSYGELAGERMKLGVMLHDPEEEHDCFSDNTHWSHYNDALGIKNVYTGTYTRVDGSKLSGPSISDLVRARNAHIDEKLRNSLDYTLMKMQVLVDSAVKDGIAYDQLLAAGNKEGNQKIMDAVFALVAQTRQIENAVEVLELDGIELEGSNSLDAPGAVQ